MKLKEYATVDLVNELRKREGVKSIDIVPEDEYSIYTLNEEIEDIEDSGPAIILIIYD